jgi:hypothetical protein
MYGIESYKRKISHLPTSPQRRLLKISFVALSTPSFPLRYKREVNWGWAVFNRPYLLPVYAAYAIYNRPTRFTALKRDINCIILLRIPTVLTIVCNTQNHSVCGICPSPRIFWYWKFRTMDKVHESSDSEYYFNCLEHTNTHPLEGDFSYVALYEFSQVICYQLSWSIFVIGWKTVTSNHV